jgi:peptide deformylase
MAKVLKTLQKEFQGNVYTYNIYGLVPADSEVLRMKTKAWDFENPQMNTKELAISLVETMVLNRGVGLAAPQIGFAYRAFAIGAGTQVQVMFNPEVIESSGELEFEEGCLSFKGLFLKIKRPEHIKVRYWDFNGQEQTTEMGGLTARTFLHELDHLDGIVYTTKVNKYWLDRAKAKQKGNIQKLDRQYEEQDKQKIIMEAARKVAADNQAKALEKQINFEIPDEVITLNVPEPEA